MVSSRVGPPVDVLAALQTATPTPSPFGPMAELLPPWASAFLATIWGQLLLAAVVMVVGWWATRQVVRYLGRPIARRFQRPSVTRSILRGGRAVGFVLTASVALAVLGFRVENVVLSVTVFSAVVGIVLAPIVGSVINGLFVLADQPYEVGDMVELVDRNRRAFVEDITLRYTKLFTLDNTFLVVPNAKMRDRDVVNFSAEDERTRLSLDLLVTYEGDLDAARDIMERAARDVDAVISGGPDIRIGSARYPARPTAYIERYGDHGVNLRLRYWVKRPYKLLTVRSMVNERVWEALAAAPDVEIAYPHQHLVFDETSGEASVRIAGDGDVRSRDGSRASEDGRDGSRAGEDGRDGSRAGEDGRDGSRAGEVGRDGSRAGEDGRDSS